jgi:hypothetical protein
MQAEWYKIPPLLPELSVDGNEMTLFNVFAQST